MDKKLLVRVTTFTTMYATAPTRTGTKTMWLKSSHWAPRFWGGGYRHRKCCCSQDLCLQWGTMEVIMSMSTISRCHTSHTAPQALFLPRLYGEWGLLGKRRALKEFPALVSMEMPPIGSGPGTNQPPILFFDQFASSTTNIAWNQSGKGRL